MLELRLIDEYVLKSYAYSRLPSEFEYVVKKF